MKFKRIEIHGFKSFADKHEIPFGNGVTAIVGPNGCGKSNVADSVRWVLGEQSAKLLRGTSMQDVIFNGTEKRKSISFCEVALVFDNREKLFPTLDYDEVVISRKLYRSGESEYAVNRTPCRLKDITELLRDGGMGREGYSIIGQGRIDELLSAKPEDRRAIFEEAAGISKYKAKKIESERKLSRTNESLIRINDILDEKSKQLEPLTRQAENARKWLNMRDQLKHHEVNTYIYQHDTASEAKGIINERLTCITDDLDHKQKTYQAAISTYNESMYNFNSIGKTIDVLREELMELTVGVEKQAGDVKVLKERLHNLFEQNKRATTENETLDGEYNAILTQIETKKQAVKDAKDRLTGALSELEQLKEQYMAVSEKISDKEDSTKSNQEALLEAMDKLAEIKSNMSRLLAEKEALKNLADDIDKRIEFNNSSVAEDKTELSDIKTELDSIKTGLQQTGDDLQKAADAGTSLRTLSDEVVSELDRLNEQYFTAVSRQKMLVEMQEAFEGFAFSVKKLMNDAKTDKRLDSKIEGVVAQVISVDAKFETAIETALGQAMQNIITKTEEDAKDIIEYLKVKKYGRVTFLPMTSIKPRSVDDRYRSVLNQRGCYGIADGLVKFDSKYAKVISGLLGGTVVAHDMDTAISIAKASGYSFRIVTLEGEIINPSGAITGGGRKNDIANIFSHDRELKELNTKVSDMSGRLEKLNILKKEYVIKTEKLAQKITELQSVKHSLELKKAALTERADKIGSGVSETDQMIESLLAEKETAIQRIEAIDKDINSVEHLNDVISEKKQLAKLSEQEFLKISEDLKTERDTVSEKLTAKRVETAETSAEIQNIENEIQRLQNEVEDLLIEIELNNQTVDGNKKLIAEIEKNLNIDESVGSEGDRKRIAEIREKLSGLDEYKEELQEKIASLDDERNRLVGEVETLQEKKTKEEILLAKVDSDIEQLEVHIQEEYELCYEQCLEFKEEGYNAQEGTQEIGRLKRSMNALGNVNIDAIEMSQEVFREYEEMDVQRNDLEKAAADLNKIIEDLSAEMLTRFNEEFAKIRVNFIKIFKELFNGGNADLILQETEDGNPLEAGVEIVAQPPEKKLLSISLLSGGERALTAIAILFAILKLKPMPFCLLDEIEAALDDANANRFAKYLRRFSEETQFIVITHRKPTMELADNLYGVTMEEKGVSKIVSVKLSEAAALADKGEKTA